MEAINNTATSTINSYNSHSSKNEFNWFKINYNNCKSFWLDTVTFFILSPYY